MEENKNKRIDQKFRPKSSCDMERKIYGKERRFPNEDYFIESFPELGFQMCVYESIVGIHVTNIMRIFSALLITTI